MDNHFGIKWLKEGFMEDCFPNRVIILQQTISKDKTVIFHSVSIFFFFLQYGLQGPTHRGGLARQWGGKIRFSGAWKSLQSWKNVWLNEPRHDKTNKMSVRPAKTQISLGIRPVSSESSLCAQWVAKDPSFVHADNEDWSDWADAQADLSLRWAHSHIVGFVMSRLKCILVVR